jgi:pimeloyl-ACP methyl ester carboxylesterase
MRLVLRTVALVALFPYLGVVLLLVTGTASWSSVAYVVALGALLGGLVTLPDPQRAGRRARPRGLSRGAVLALAAIAVARAFVAGEGRHLQLSPGGEGGRAEGGARWMDRLVDEGDMATAGTRVLLATGMLRDDERELPSAMTSAYGAMRRDQGDAPSPVLATYLGRQSPDAFDLVVIEPDRAASDVTTSPRSALVFLHGYAGNFDLPCWQVARAVASAGVVTACPSTRWVGDWWSPAGEATLRRTIEVLKARGIDRIVLAGLSNGGYGAARLARRMNGTFAGLVLVSGADPATPPAGIPTLVIHGSHDTMASYESARLYAANAGAKLVTLDAGHFAMLVKSEQADRAVRDFVITALRDRRSDARRRRAGTARPRLGPRSRAAPHPCPRVACCNSAAPVRSGRCRC